MMVVIATAGRPDLLRRTLQSLCECDQPLCYRGTIVVENGDRRGAEEVVASFSARLRCRYLFVETSNKSLSLNVALQACGESLVYLADDDVRFSPGTLEAYAAAAAGISSGRYFGGPTGVDYEIRPPDWLMRYLPISALGWSAKPDGTQDELDFLGFNWAAFAGDLRRVGGFNINRGPGAASGSTGQESEMQARLRRDGVKSVYVPDAMVWHYVPADRCSPEWAIARAYRNAVQVALASPKPHFTLFGQPMWLVLRHGKGRLRHLVGEHHQRPDVQF